MAYTARQYARALHELSLTQGEEEQRATAACLAQRLKEEGRVGMLAEITDEVARLEEQDTQRDSVRIVSAHELSDAEKERLKKEFPAATHEFTHDPDLISGLVVQKNHSVFYATLAKASQQLRAGIVR